MTHMSAYGTGPLLKARCPECARVISGGRVRDRRGTVIRLRVHNYKPPPGSLLPDARCVGSGREVDATASLPKRQTEDS